MSTTASPNDTAPGTAEVTRRCAALANRLAAAHDATDPHAVIAVRADAEALRAHVVSVRALRADCLAVTELVRRAERALGLVVRTLQARGVYAPPGNNGGHPSSLPTAAALFSSKSTMHEYFTLADLAPGTFEDVIARCVREGNLSRAAVMRRFTSRARSNRIARSSNGAPPRQRRIDSNRIVEQAAIHSGLPNSTAELIDYAELDRARLDEWIESLSSAIQSLSALRNNLRKVAREGIRQ